MESKKRVDIVSLKMCKEGSILYSPRKITAPSDAVKLVKHLIAESDREKFVVVALDTKNQPVSMSVCSVGSLNASIVHPREVFKMGILSNAASILVAHNHPSGDTAPSREDLKISERLIHAGEIIGIKVLDHLIIGNDNYLSLRESGHIEVQS